MLYIQASVLVGKEVLINLLEYLVVYIQASELVSKEVSIN